MSRRPGTKSPSTVNLQFRATAEEADGARALAEYENEEAGKAAESFSDMVRRLINAERKRLRDAGFRPPLKPRRRFTEGNGTTGA
jgi:hypothetical protein